MNLINDKRYWSRSKDWNSRFKKFLKRSYNKDFDVSRFLKSKTKTRFFEPRFSFCFCSHFTPCFTIKYELRRFFQNHGSELYTGWWKEWRGNGSIILSKILIKTVKILIFHQLLILNTYSKHVVLNVHTGVTETWFYISLSILTVNYAVITRGDVFEGTLLWSQYLKGSWLMTSCVKTQLLFILLYFLWDVKELKHYYT